ncbi:MAG: hypothetical protein K8I82_18715 [Anaerolineae bacterium]|nr:hypothetical protein [Anaerolineae bacterium]
MSQNLNQLPDIDYSADSFGTPQYGQAPKRRGGCLTSTPILILGGCGVLVMLVCLCCVGAVVVVARQPAGAVAMWGAGAQVDWTFSERFVCDGSQAERITQDYKERNIQFSSQFNAVQDTNNSNRVEVTSDYTEDGQTQDWEAVFITKSGGGFLGNCIDQINVTTGE